MKQLRHPFVWARRLLIKMGRGEEVSLSQFQLSLHILFHDASTKRTMGTAIGRLVLALTLVSVLTGMTVAELSSTSLCRRWSHQGKFVQTSKWTLIVGALVDSKLYIYGGKSKSWVNASKSIWGKLKVSTPTNVV